MVEGFRGQVSELVPNLGGNPVKSQGFLNFIKFFVGLCFSKLEIMSSSSKIARIEGNYILEKLSSRRRRPHPEPMKAS